MWYQCRATKESVSIVHCCLRKCWWYKVNECVRKSGKELDGADTHASQKYLLLFLIEYSVGSTQITIVDYIHDTQYLINQTM